MANHIAGLLLAAGGSQRLKTPKQLLKISNQYLINHMIKIIKSGGLSDLFVILGASYEKINPLIQDKYLKILKNRKWQDGLSTSIKKGIVEISSMGIYDAVIIFVVDQPFLDSASIKMLLTAFKTQKSDIVALRLKEEQINPVLFSRNTFDQLLALEKNQSGKNVIYENQVSWIDTENEKLAIDIDTEKDFKEVEDKLYLLGGEE